MIQKVMEAVKQVLNQVFKARPKALPSRKPAYSPVQLPSYAAQLKLIQAMKTTATEVMCVESALRAEIEAVLS